MTFGGRRMKCPFCAASESRVIDSRPAEEDTAIRRRRECISCSRRFTTYEKIETQPALVIKKDGRRESFSIAKVRDGLRKACEKRPVSAAAMDALLSDIETQVANTLDQEISTAAIGEMVMERLKDLDEVAYVRFASVYRQFRDVNSFMEELQKLITR